MAQDFPQRSAAAAVAMIAGTAAVASLLFFVQLAAPRTRKGPLLEFDRGQILPLQLVEVPFRTPEFSPVRKSLRTMALADNAVYTFNNAGAPTQKIEEGQCIADMTCGNTCEKCPGCQCLMTDGRVVSCDNGSCLCTENCLCKDDSDCPQACGQRYSPSLCGIQVCRTGACFEVFDLNVADPAYQMPEQYQAP